LGATDIKASRNQRDSSRLNLFDRHTGVSGLFSEPIGELNEVHEVGVLKAHTEAARVCERTITQVLRVPDEEVEKCCDWQECRE
jgi:hypothetical protein